MKEFLPSITVHNGFYIRNMINTSNINNPHKRFFSYDNTNKNNYQINPNSNIKYKESNLINPNNYLIVSNANKDTVNSNKNNTSKTYYNRGFSDNNKHIKNIIPDTFYNNNNKSINKINIGPKKNELENILLNSYNNNKIMKNNEINIVNKTILRNFQLFLPEVQNDNKIKKVFNKQSPPIIINNNANNNSINLSITNSLYKTKKDNNNSKRKLFNHEKIDCQNIHPIKSKDSLTAIGFLDNRKNNYTLLNEKNNISDRKTLSTDIKYNKVKVKDKNEENKKSLALFNNIKNIKNFANINYMNINININNNINNININNPKNENNNDEIILKNKITPNTNIIICPICHKEKEIKKYTYHLTLHPSKILDWLYLGSYRNACDEKDIKNLGINYVLNCAVECKESFPSNVKYCHLKISDRPKFKIINFLDKASDFINEAQSNDGIILVHCQLGISRSTTCVISYFIKYLGYTAMNALNFIKKKRTQVMPNDGFLNQLKIYEKNYIGSGQKK